MKATKTFGRISVLLLLTGVLFAVASAGSTLGKFVFSAEIGRLDLTIKAPPKFSTRVELLSSEEFDSYYKARLDAFANDAEHAEEYADMVAEVSEFFASPYIETREDGYPYHTSGEFLLYDLYSIINDHLRQAYPDEPVPTAAWIYAERSKRNIKRIIFVKASEFDAPAHNPFDLPIDEFGLGTVRIFHDEGGLGGGWGDMSEETYYFIIDDVNFEVEQMVAPESLANFFEGYQKLEEVHFNGLLDVSRVTDFSGMFSGCSNLKAIYTTALDDWSQITATGTDMFLGCTGLVGGNGTGYDPSHTDLAYARPDGASGLPGYFTVDE